MFASVNGCLSQDWFLLPYELQLQRVHAGVLTEAGVLTGDELKRIESALDAIGRAFLDQPCPASDLEDIHTWIEAQLIERVGDAGKRIHTARSRNDQVATLLKMFLIDAAGRLCGQVQRLIRVACRQADSWADLVFPLQTHAQFAAPGSVGFWALRYAASMRRVLRRLHWAETEWKHECPLGAGAVAGSSIPIDRARQAVGLGFTKPSVNALDATSTRDECLELLSIGAQAALHLQSLAEDVIAFAQTPFSWVNYPMAFGTGSSMMPNKTNPDAMELMRGNCAQLLAAPNEAILLLSRLPSGYNRDLQCVKPLVHRTATLLSDMLTLAAEFLDVLSFNDARLKQSLAAGSIDATLRMEAMIQQGVPMREAHHQVAASLADTAPFDPDVVNRYATTGSASPAETRESAREILESLDS